MAIKTPAAGVAASGKALEFRDAALRVVSAGNGLQVVANQLIQAFPESLRFLSRPRDELIVD